MTGAATSARTEVRALVVLALLLGAGGLALGVVNLLREGVEPWREVTLRLVEKEDGFKFSDVAPKAKSEEDISAGDSFVFSGDVSGARKGRLAGACQVAAQGEPTCHATYTLGDDQVTIAGVPDFSQQAETFTIPVTGGSGRYQGATGHITVRETTRAEHDITLLVPNPD